MKAKLLTQCDRTNGQENNFCHITEINAINADRYFKESEHRHTPIDINLQV